VAFLGLLAATRLHADLMAVLDRRKVHDDLDAFVAVVDTSEKIEVVERERRIAAQKRHCVVILLESNRGDGVPELVLERENVGAEAGAEALFDLRG
jgi:hypothetical protein